MRPLSTLVATTLTLVVLLPFAAEAAGPQARSGEAIYHQACLSCHGPDGRGQPQSLVGFATELPDFTSCSFATPERDADWHAIIEQGGRVRSFDRKMPAFGDALTPADIDAVIGYLRRFCRDRRWPRGDLNLPRPFITEKAFPENEAVVTTTIDRTGGRSVENAFVYEHRLGARSQYEVVVPFTVARGETGGWDRGLGDIAVALKRALYDNLRTGSIVSVGGEVTFPTGKETAGLGGGATILEPFAAYSQMLPRDGFVHVHGGFGRSTRHALVNDEAYLRTAIGRTFTQGSGGRGWSPMVEVTATRELGSGESVKWDVVPQLQITLSRRQHIMANGGVQVPVNDRDTRRTAVLVYLLWDWFDGGLFEGWR